MPDFSKYIAAVRASMELNFPRFSAFRASSVALILANTLPLYGVIFLDWDAFSIVALYWVENVVIGLISLLKLVICRRGALLSTPFFVLHYGLFCFIHGVFILGLFGNDSMIMSPMDEVREFARLFTEQHLWWAIAALTVSHLYSFAVNFIGRAEFRRATLPELMSQTYSRVIVLHIAILFGGWIAMALGSNLGVLFLLVLGKTLFDLKLHLREHEKLDDGSSDAPTVEDSVTR